MAAKTNQQKVPPQEIEPTETPINVYHTAKPKSPPPGPCLTKDEAIKHVFEKNAELYRRLAQ